MILYFFIGFCAGALIMLSILGAWFETSRFGNLHSIDDGEDDGPYLFLELNKNPEKLAKQKYVVLMVKKSSTQK